MMKHVSRTHGVPLDWFFDRVNLDPKIQIKYVDTKNQLADEPSPSSVQHHEFLDVFLQPFSFNEKKKPNTMSKRVQERRTGEEPVVAKSRPVSVISRSLSANQSPMLDSGTSYSSGKCRLGWNSDFTSAQSRKLNDKFSSVAHR